MSSFYTNICQALHDGKNALTNEKDYRSFLGEALCNYMDSVNSLSGSSASYQFEQFCQKFSCCRNIFTSDSEFYRFMGLFYCDLNASMNSFSTIFNTIIGSALRINFEQFTDTAARFPSSNSFNVGDSSPSLNVAPINAFNDAATGFYLIEGAERKLSLATNASLSDPTGSYVQIQSQYRLNGSIPWVIIGVFQQYFYNLSETKYDDMGFVIIPTSAPASGAFDTIELRQTIAAVNRTVLPTQLTINTAAPKVSLLYWSNNLF